jgi:hypothetical protein
LAYYITVRGNTVDDMKLKRNILKTEKYGLLGCDAVQFGQSPIGKVQYLIFSSLQKMEIRRGSDKSSAFPIFLFAVQPKEFFLDGLNKLEQRSHKCVELRGGNV